MRRAALVFGATGTIAGAPEALAGGGGPSARFAPSGRDAFRAHRTQEATRARFPEFAGIAAAART